MRKVGVLAGTAAAAGLLALPVLFAPAMVEASTLPMALWGAYGHHIAARAAIDHLPRGMPRFFRKARNQLVYLSPEPDRWRSRELKEMDDAWEFDHYIDLENVPEGALNEPDRFEFLEVLFEAGIERPQQFVGFLPFRIVEVYQRLQTEFALWRNAESRRERKYVEARVLNDAGILAHYAADAAQPHHTTIHFNGWAENVPNPRGFSTERDFHARFESAFVEAHIVYEDVGDRMAPEPLELGDVRQAVLSHVRESNASVEQMYELEQAFGFEPEEAHPETREFTIQRLTAGAEMLRALWWRAWLDSEGLAARMRETRMGRG
ncbi:hypothetical protein ACFL3S_01625 [Gemmatimonadota bacterium]